MTDSPKRRHADHTLNGRADRIAEAAIVKLSARLSMVLLIPLLAWVAFKYDSRLEAVEKLSIQTAQELAVEIKAGEAHTDTLKDHGARLGRVEARERGP